MTNGATPNTTTPNSTASEAMDETNAGQPMVMEFIDALVPMSRCSPRPRSHAP